MASEVYKARSALNGSTDRLTRWDEEIDRIDCVLANRRSSIRLHEDVIKDLEAKREQAVKARMAEQARNELYRDRYMAAKSQKTVSDTNKLLLALPRAQKQARVGPEMAQGDPED